MLYPVVIIARLALEIEHAKTGSAKKSVKYPVEHHIATKIKRAARQRTRTPAVIHYGTMLGTQWMWGLHKHLIHIKYHHVEAIDTGKKNRTANVVKSTTETVILLGEKNCIKRLPTVVNHYADGIKHQSRIAGIGAETQRTEPTKSKKNNCCAVMNVFRIRFSAKLYRPWQQQPTEQSKDGHRHNVEQRGSSSAKLEEALAKKTSCSISISSHMGMVLFSDTWVSSLWKKLYRAKRWWQWHPSTPNTWRPDKDTGAGHPSPSGMASQVANRQLANGKRKPFFRYEMWRRKDRTTFLLMCTWNHQPSGRIPWQ